ncbi:MAG: leucine-rich repeat domain-containing protein [Candidatus Thorarchaeota archaeon]
MSDEDPDLVLYLHSTRHGEISRWPGFHKRVAESMEKGRARIGNPIQLFSFANLEQLTKMHAQIEILRGRNLEFETIDLSSISNYNNLQILELRHGCLRHIDLEPLVSLTNLRQVKLPSNQLQSIDLEPLGACSNLRKLDLSNNQLQEVDLSPLAQCKKLKNLSLKNNRIESIQLYPSCCKMNEFDLRDNLLKHIDLSPFHKYRNKTVPLLKRNPLERLDITPLIWNPMGDSGLRENLPWFQWIELDSVYRKPYYTYPTWKPYYYIARERNNRLVHNDILFSLGLGHLGFVDSELSDVILSVPPRTPIEKATQKIERKVVDLIAAQIERGATTMWLDIEKTSKYPEIASRADRILQLRDAEMGKTTVLTDGHQYVNPKPLFLTVYGNQILTGLGYHASKFYSIEEFQPVYEAVNKFGFNLSSINVDDARMGYSADDSDPTKVSDPVNMSDELKNYIWFLADQNSSDTS